MANITAKLNYYRSSPRKVRLLADLIRGKEVNDALAHLKFASKKSAPAIEKLLKSAISNAKNNHKIDIDNTILYIKEIRVDEGPAYKRWRPVWRRMAHAYKKRTSHINIVLGEKREKAKK